jgi:hypothetical protein
MAVVTTDLSVPDDIDTLHVNVWAAGAQTPFFFHDYALQGPSALSLPGTLGVVAGPRTTRVTIQVSGLLQGLTRVSREATVTLPTDRVATLSMPLDWLCMGAACTSGQTCQAGACIPDVDPPIPDDYVPASPADGGAADSGGACFDTSACFASAVLWSAPPGGDCSLPRPPGADVNVALVVAGGDGICSRGSCLVPLDAESAEGWRTSPDGTRIDLPPAVCTNGNVRALEVTTTCPTKPANAAICPGVGSPIVAGGCVADTDGGCPDGYACDSSAGQDQCVRIDSGTTPACLPDPTVLCAGGATGYSCMPSDPSLQCAQLRSDNACGISGLCCVSAGDAGTCTVDAEEGGVLIDDMSGQTADCAASQPKLPIVHAGDTAGYWYASDDRTDSGSMVPLPGTEFTYTPVTATCSAPFSSAACIKSVRPYLSFNPAPLMGLQFEILAPIPDGGNATPAAYDVTRYRGIQFWARASDAGSQSVTVQFADSPNDGAIPGSACNVTPPYKCFNYYQHTLPLVSTWAPYEVDFDMLSQVLDAGLNTTPMFTQNAALAINFMVDGVTPLTFDLCVAEIYFVPK